MANLSVTYGLEELKSGEMRLSGRRDELAALQQAIRLMLQVEAGAYEIYSAAYGLRLDDLWGRDYPYVVAELERRIRECVLSDERVEAVEDFVFSHKGGKVLVAFTVRSIWGDTAEEVELAV